MELEGATSTAPVTFTSTNNFSNDYEQYRGIIGNNNNIEQSLNGVNEADETLSSLLLLLKSRDSKEDESQATFTTSEEQNFPLLSQYSHAANAVVSMENAFRNSESSNKVSSNTLLETDNGLCRNMKIDDLRKYFHLPIIQVAKQLGTCTTALKRICRRNGIEKWPYRQIRSISRNIHNLETVYENEALHEDLRSQYLEQINSLRKVAEAIVYNPSIPISSKKRKRDDMPQENSEENSEDGPLSTAPHNNQGLLKNNPSTAPKGRTRDSTSYDVNTGWIADCHKCGREGKFRSPSEGRPFQHSTGFGKYCGYFRVNPRKADLSMSRNKISQDYDAAQNLQQHQQPPPHQSSHIQMLHQHHFQQLQQMQLQQQHLQQHQQQSLMLLNPSDINNSMIPDDYHTAMTSLLPLSMATNSSLSSNSLTYNIINGSGGSGGGKGNMLQETRHPSNTELSSYSSHPTMISGSSYNQDSHSTQQQKKQQQHLLDLSQHQLQQQQQQLQHQQQLLLVPLMQQQQQQQELYHHQHPSSLHSSQQAPPLPLTHQSQQQQQQQQQQSYHHHGSAHANLLPSSHYPSHNYAPSSLLPTQQLYPPHAPLVSSEQQQQQQQDQEQHNHMLLQQFLQRHVSQPRLYPESVLPVHYPPQPLPQHQLQQQLLQQYPHVQQTLSTSSTTILDDSPKSSSSPPQHRRDYSQEGIAATDPPNSLSHPFMHMPSKESLPGIDFQLEGYQQQHHPPQQ